MRVVFVHKYTNLIESLLQKRLHDLNTKKIKILNWVNLTCPVVSVIKMTYQFDPSNAADYVVKKYRVRGSKIQL